MPLYLISILFFAALLALISWVGYRFYARPGRYFEQLGTVVITNLPGGQGGGTVRILKTIGEKIPVSPDEAIMTRRLLMAAGYRDDGALAAFLGFRAVVMIGCVLLALACLPLISVYVLKIVAIVFAGIVSLFLPGMVLDFLVSARQERLRLSLPDALDLMVVCVEAGLGLDQAISNVSKELMKTHPEISDEFALINGEMRAGKRRIDALRNLASRTGEPELRKLVAILIQTDRFGTSIADSLRTHSDYMRIRRRQAAEERAAKVGVKLVFPIFVCILPAMLVVVAGPGILQLFKQLFPLMEQFRQSQGG